VNVARKLIQERLTVMPSPRKLLFYDGSITESNVRNTVTPNKQKLQNYWGFGLFPSSGILENTKFRKLDLFPSSGEGGGEDTYSVGPLRKRYS
jgi:hypothetical protein